MTVINAFVSWSNDAARKPLSASPRRKARSKQVATGTEDTQNLRRKRRSPSGPTARFVSNERQVRGGTTRHTYG